MSFSSILMMPGGSLPRTWVSTELNSLAAGSWAISNAIDVDADLLLEVDLYLAVTFGSAPTADGPIYVYEGRSLGNGTYVDLSATGPILPKNGLLGQFLVRSVNTAQVIDGPKNVRLSPTDLKLAIGNGASQAFPSSGSVIYAVPSGLKVGT